MEDFANLIYYAIAFVIFIIIISAILRRLGIIANNTFRTSKHPVVRHYFEAKIFESTGDKKEALQEYFRCYVALKHMKYKWVFIPGGGKITENKIISKIEELGGDLSKLS